MGFLQLGNRLHLLRGALSRYFPYAFAVIMSMPVARPQPLVNACFSVLIGVVWNLPYAINRLRRKGVDMEKLLFRFRLCRVFQMVSWCPYFILVLPVSQSKGTHRLVLP
jgi:hypothetical protein